MGWLIFVWILIAYQILSIVIATNKAAKSGGVNEKKRMLHKMSCTIGVPAVVGLIASIVMLFVGKLQWIALIVLIVVTVLGLFKGADLYKAIFKNESTNCKVKKHK